MSPSSHAHEGEHQAECCKDARQANSLKVAEHCGSGRLPCVGSRRRRVLSWRLASWRRFLSLRSAAWHNRGTILRHRWRRIYRGGGLWRGLGRWHGRGVNQGSIANLPEPLGEGVIGDFRAIDWFSRFDFVETGFGPSGNQIGWYSLFGDRSLDDPAHDAGALPDDLCFGARIPDGQAAPAGGATDVHQSEALRCHQPGAFGGVLLLRGRHASDTSTAPVRPPVRY